MTSPELYPKRTTRPRQRWRLIEPEHCHLEIRVGSVMKRRPIMKVVSVNVGLPREVLWKGRKVTTGIFKDPVAGPVQVRKLNLEGDQQADLTVHGGPEKAVYAYPAE